jgi:hypothetical protein
MKIYIAGPYTGNTSEEVEGNVRKSMEAGLVIWKKGHFPYIPHLTHWPDLCAKELKIDMNWADYMQWHAPWVDLCDAIFLLAKSKGASLEMQRAIRTERKVFRFLDEIPTVKQSKTWVDDFILE